jgi:hypothetical protein
MAEYQFTLGVGELNSMWPAGPQMLWTAKEGDALKFNIGKFATEEPARNSRLPYYHILRNV